MIRFEKIVNSTIVFDSSAEMILERLNLQDILEEEQRSLLELEKLKESQKSNPTGQKKSPCTRSEINRTTGIIVERTIENIKSVNHSTVDVSKESEGLLESDLPVKLTDADSSEGNQKQITDGKSDHVHASQIGSGHLPATQATNITADKMTKPNMDKSLNIQDVSLTEMLNSSNEDEDPVNVSSIIGSLRVGQSLTDVASQASLVGSNVQERNMKANVPSKTSTPIRPHSSGKNVSVPTNKPSTSKSQLSLASTYNGPKSNTDSLENQEKSAIRKTIENRLTQVNYKSALTEQSRSEADTNNDLLTAIEGEHRLICVTDKQAKKSKEKSGKKLSSKLKEKLNIAASKDKASVDMEQRGNAFEENGDFETAGTTSVVGRKRKRINVIDDSDDENDNESGKSSKTKDQINKEGAETMRHSSAKQKSDKRRKVVKSKENTKDSQSTSKDSGKIDNTLNESSNDPTPAAIVSKKTLSKLQKFAFDDSRSSSSDSFLSNTSLSSSMLSGSLWISHDKTGKSSQKTDSGADNEENEEKDVKPKRHKADNPSSVEITMSANDGKDKSGGSSKSWKETEKDKHINSICASKMDIQTSGVSPQTQKTQNDNSSTIGSKLSKFRLNTSSTAVLQSSENTSGSNRSSPLLSSSMSSAVSSATSNSSVPQKSENNSTRTSVSMNSSKPTSSTVLPSSQNSSSLNKSSVLLTDSSPSWLMALKSKKPSPIFTASDTNDIDLDLDDLEFGENPFVKSKFS